MCRGSDGRWGALDARLLYAHAKTAGFLYESHLRHRLSADLGVDWSQVENGIADVASVREELLTLFSKRSREIRGRLDEVTERINAERVRLGLAPVEADSQEALDIAARETRAAKLKHVATADLRAGWCEEARAAGLDVEELASVLHRITDESQTADPDLHRRVAAGATENASTFGHREAIQGMAADARRGLPVAAVLERTEEMLASDEVIPVVGAVRNQDVIRRADGVVAPVPTGERRWSTPEMLSVESRLVDSAIGRQQDGVAIVPAGVLHETLMSSLARLPSLGADQIEMVAGLAGSGAGVECVEAAPGTGKTSALGVYVAACRRAGIPVIGCAPSAQARDQLRLGARLDRCYTVDRLLIELSHEPLGAGSVVILDEASMAGSRKLGRLLQRAAASRAKVVLVGDTKQLSSVDAGGGFRGLVARMGAHELRENRRQVQQWERDALRDLRDGRVRPAMTAYAAHGRLHMGDSEELVQRMTDDWWAARSHGEAVMQASSWRDVLELNERARERLVDVGLVEHEGLDVRGVTVGVGDQVIVLRNAYHLGVINGTLGKVTAIDRERGELVVQTIEAEPRSVRLLASFWNAKGRRRVALAYCRTIHKAQGATYQGASFTLAGDDTIHLEAVHVALSRGTEANHLYYMGEPPPDEDHHLVEVSKPEHERLVAATARSRAQVMALDLVAGMADAPVSAGSDGADAPMTEAQVRVLARHGAMPERDLTWVEASLLIDDAIQVPRGKQAMIWLQENGATAEESAKIIAAAERDLRNPSRVGAGGAAAARREQLELALRAGRPVSRGESRELDSLRRNQAHTAADLRRRRRRAWARSSAAAAPSAASAVPAARASPRIAR